MRRILFVVVILGCGAASDQRVDAGNGHPGDGAATDAMAHSVTNVVCDKTQTRSIPGASGAHIDTVTRYALLTVDPTSYYAVEQCDPTGEIVPVPCTASNTCSGDVLGAPCQWTSSGAFYAGKLEVVCSTNITSYDGTGAVVSTNGYSYNTIRLHN
jgi:hypothetical protein